ncbi:hypothetical protein PILCRDRAFT_1331 [Piloderma croceum F 1598]|uniref:Uncharacterized protein n=1 Tax=Piloderma croceum (strain F 1598) TaxID=765440 RepID=A0A0C3BXA1_PILCF|nr:hypothetical protein PILCRDRAFT_1331 [Piloderma croceum F 1598]
MARNLCNVPDVFYVSQPYPDCHDGHIYAPPPPPEQYNQPQHQFMQPPYQQMPQPELHGQQQQPFMQHYQLLHQQRLMHQYTLPHQPMQHGQPMPNHEAHRTLCQQCQRRHDRILKYVLVVKVIAGNAKREFQAETDMVWDDFHSLVLAYLDSTSDMVELVYKFLGDTGKASHLNDAPCFVGVMECLCQKVSNAHTQAVGLEVKNTASKNTTSKTKKRTREDNIPPTPSEENATQLKSYKQLESAIRCELHHGHCFINRTSGHNNHRHLNHSEMTLWAKKISLGQVTIYNTPHCLNFDCGLTKKPRHLTSPSTPEVHITIQNITSDPTGASISYKKTPSPSPLSQPPNPTHSNPPEECALSGSFPLSGSTPPPLYSETYSPIKCILELIEADKPGKGYNKLKGILGEAGLVSSNHLVMLLEDVMCIIGNIGKMQVRVLHNYVKCSVLPLLRLQGNYDDPEIASPDKGNGNAITAVENSAMEDVLWQLEDKDEESNEDDGYYSGSSEAEL